MAKHKAEKRQEQRMDKGDKSETKTQKINKTKQQEEQDTREGPNSSKRGRPHPLPFPTGHKTPPDTESTYEQGKVHTCTP